MAFYVINRQCSISKHGIQCLTVHGQQGQIQMNDEEYANDHKAGCMYETAEFLGSLREVVPEHQCEAVGCDGGLAGVDDGMRAVP